MFIYKLKPIRLFFFTLKSNPIIWVQTLKVYNGLYFIENPDVQGFELSESGLFTLLDRS